jgi:hypothetical protein
MKMIVLSAGLAMVLQTTTAGLGAGATQRATCEGYCNVTCGSGATYSYYEPNYWCCDRLDMVCPDGSSAHSVEWSPVTCGNPETC